MRTDNEASLGRGLGRYTLKADSGKTRERLLRRILGGRISRGWDRVWAHCTTDERREKGRAGNVTGS